MNIEPNMYMNFQDFAKLRAEAREGSEQGLQQVARQFESLFLQTMMKSMRDASIGDDLFSNDQTEFYQDLYDQQLAIHLSEQGSIGITDLLVRQLGNTSSPEVSEALVSDSSPASITKKQAWQTPEEFLTALWPAAEAAAQKIGTSPDILLAVAALETGWGKHVMSRPNGQSAYNLFGIKADKRWAGDHVISQTLEFEQGEMVKRNEHFRAYNNPVESFNDYVDFLQSNPRYQTALQHTGDARAFLNNLQSAGYATDPEYADKVLRVLASEPFNKAVSSVGI